MRPTSFVSILFSVALLSASVSVGASEASLQQDSFLKWADQKEIEIRNRVEPINTDTTFNEPVYLPLAEIPKTPPTPAEALRLKNTAELYFKVIGRNTVESLLWSGIESGNPLTRHEEYRWNSLREQGLYDAGNRQKLIRSLKQAGIHNIRLGMSNHEIDVDQDSTWSATSAMIEDFYRGGLNISLDLHHFGIEDRFRVANERGETVGEKSYYLNSAWPKYFARFARKAIEKYHGKIKAITIMNEPETVAGFNGEMWHGGFPGWSNGQTNKFYIQRSLQVGMASVLARYEIEDYLAKLPAEVRPHLLFIHTEASVHKTYWKDFNFYRRFVISDMILGHDWLLKADLDALAKTPMSELDGRWHRLNDRTRTNLDWVIENYLIYNQDPAQREELRTDLVQRLRDLKNAHLRLSKFKKTMKTDTVLAIDYYSHNEDKDVDGVRLNPEPQYYVNQIRAGRRVGLYQVLIEYYNRYQMPLMIGESGTPYYYYGARWSQQVLLECAKAAQQGIPFLGYTLYPAVDTWGWESALSVPRDKALYNPSGVVDLEYQARPFIGRLVTSLRKVMKSLPLAAVGF
jgi:beta-glucosidase/6-phospho-beta-glucosidase/beta-galactosidase